MLKIYFFNSSNLIPFLLAILSESFISIEDDCRRKDSEERGQTGSNTSQEIQLESNVKQGKVNSGHSIVAILVVSYPSYQLDSNSFLCSQTKLYVVNHIKFHSYVFRIL